METQRLKKIYKKTCHLFSSSFSPADLRPDSVCLSGLSVCSIVDEKRRERKHNITQHNKLLRFSADFHGVRVCMCTCVRVRPYVRADFLSIEFH